MQFKQLALRSIFSILIGGSVGIYMAVHGYGLLSLIAQQVITTLVGTAFLWSVTHWRPGLDTTKEHVIGILKYARYVTFDNTMNLANSQSDVFLSAYFLGPVSTGTYNAAKRLILSLNLIIATSIRQVSLPAIANCSDSDENMKKVVLGFIRYTSTLSMPIFMGTAILSPSIVYILMGDNWSDVHPILSIMCVACYIQTMTLFCSNVLYAKNKFRDVNILTFASSLLNIVLLLIAAPFGLIYVALAFLIKTALIAIVSTYIVLINLPIQLKEIIYEIYPSFISVLAMCVIIGVARVYILPLSPVLDVIVYVPLGAVIYGGCLFIIRKEDIKNVLSSFLALKKGNDFLKNNEL
jgi:O-antigen/teichoic acid export membrane protein